MKLYEIKAEYEDILHRFRQAESEEDLAAIAEELGKIEGKLEEKLDNCARVFRTLEVEAEAYKQESKRLAGKANVLDNRADRLKNYIGLCLGAGNRAKTELFDFSWLKSQSVKIEDETLIPDRYKRIETISEPNKAVIKKDLKDNVMIPGVSLVDSYNLQIK